MKKFIVFGVLVSSMHCVDVTAAYKSSSPVSLAGLKVKTDGEGTFYAPLSAGGSPERILLPLGVFDNNLLVGIVSSPISQKVKNQLMNREWPSTEESGSRKK